MHTHNHQGHHHHHHHGHSQASVNSERLIRYGMVLTFVVFLIKIIGGYWTGSLALLSDGWHLAGDLLTLALSWWGVKQSLKPANRKQSFGMFRAEILSAFTANLILVAVGGYILIEAMRGFAHPAVVSSTWIFWLTLAGLVIYTALTYMLSKEKDNMNARSAWMHFLGDALSSLAILVGAVIIHFTSWYWVDAVLGGLVGVVIIVGAGKMAWEGAHILLEFAPSHVEPDQVEQVLLKLQHVSAVTDLHIWSLTPTQHFMSCHLAVDVTTIGDGETIIRLVQQTLLDQFNVHHVTIQLETSSCSTCFHNEVDLESHCVECPQTDNTCQIINIQPN
ncbi:cation diffusion facilitator family transporter [Tumebacillus permanentifrigoris]|uniref:Cobalt-zinc-cadmium efflux system protein n=1 Tax=Tumebacillus permanentifrigoris TaxID=378543 RepID=A0A316D509_9BACL|nr:cation diffusion facilitator family transporter [Tumebacillus permanentifrigoris]PWK08372.1 cobalt-zinc-cadmium efflux system protein [Tumebacillus permanentifrigoris]